MRSPAARLGIFTLSIGLREAKLSAAQPRKIGKEPLLRVQESEECFAASPRLQLIMCSFESP